MTDVRVIKFGAGSETDRAMERLGATLHARSMTEAFRIGVAIADYVTQAQAAGKRVLIIDRNGGRQELVAG